MLSTAAKTLTAHHGAHHGQTSYQNTPVDVKIVLSSLWVAMVFVFAYVDIFAFYRADVLNAAMGGALGATGLPVNQVLLTGTLVFILLPCLMVVLSLLLPARKNRVANIAVALVCSVAIVLGCIGESWAYYLIGSAVEVALLLAVARTAWAWPRS